MKKFVNFLALSILFSLFCLSCSNGTVAQPSGKWESEDQTLFLDFETLTGTMTQNGETRSIDVLYSYTLKQIAFYSDQQEIFIGSFLLEEDRLTISDKDDNVCYLLTLKDK